MAKRKMTKGQTTIYNTLHRISKTEQHETILKTGGELLLCGRVGSSRSTIVKIEYSPVISGAGKKTWGTEELKVD